MDPDNKQAVANQETFISVGKCKVENTDDVRPSLNQIKPAPSKMASKTRDRIWERFECDYCKNLFYRKVLLVLHLRTCKGHKIDDTVYPLWYKAKIRIDKTCVPHEYRCTVCDYRGKDKLTVKDHVINNHSSTVPYKCKMCEEGFRRKDHLTKHVFMKHGDSAPSSCDICGKSFKWGHSKRAHMRYKHNNQIFKCGICKRNMYTAINLEQHMLLHEKMDQVACHLCGMTFKRKRQLSAHMYMHEDFKPFSCPFCGKSFRKRYQQEQHTLVHTTLRPYVCSICGVSFTQKWSLLDHRKIHPGPPPPIPKIPLGDLIMDYIEELQAASREFQEDQGRADGLDLIQPKVEMSE